MSDTQDKYPCPFDKPDGYPSAFDKMIGEAIRAEIERQSAAPPIDWGLVGYAAVEAYGFGPDTMRGGTWPTGLSSGPSSKRASEERPANTGGRKTVG